MLLFLEIKTEEMEKFISLMKHSGAEAETVFTYMLDSLGDYENNWSILKGEQLAVDVAKGKVGK